MRIITHSLIVQFVDQVGVNSEFIMTVKFKLKFTIIYGIY